MRIPLLVVSSLAIACDGAGPPTSATSGSADMPEIASALKPDALKPGDVAPAVTMALSDGTTVELSSLKDRLVLVYFYPKDDTPGCTIEAQGVRDAWAKFQAAGIQVYGVSTQDARSHQAFIAKHELPFPLVVDGEGSVASAFKVPLKNGNAARQSFLIKNGKIKAVWLEVNPAEHAQTVLQAAEG